MTMWTTEAINAEVAYRRENLTRLANLTRISRRHRAARAERPRAERDHATGDRAELGTAGRVERHRETTLPAQRTSDDHAVTKQSI